MGSEKEEKFDEQKELKKYCKGLKKQVDDFLADFIVEHNKMARKQHSSLQALVKGLADPEVIQERKKYCEEIKKYVADFFDSFIVEFNKMAKKQHSSLQALVKGLADPEVIQEREKFCKGIGKYVDDVLNVAHKKRKKSHRSSKK